MSSIFCYKRQELPEILEKQLLSFLKAEWPWVFEGEPPFWDEVAKTNQPINFLAVADGLLLSHAEVTQRELECAGSSYKVYGVGAVFTSPDFRKKGHGHRIVKEATDYIMASDADIGMLFCDDSLRGFYAGIGWEVIEKAKILCGPEDDPWLNEGEAVMCVFPSTQGKLTRVSLEQYPVYVGVQHW